MQPGESTERASAIHGQIAERGLAAPARASQSGQSGHPGHPAAAIGSRAHWLQTPTVPLNWASAGDCMLHVAAVPEHLCTLSQSCWHVREPMLPMHA